MLEMGLVVAIGMAVVFMKVGWKGRMWMISHSLLMDIFIFVLLNFLHWGTFSGVMVAAVGALFCSLFLSAMKFIAGHIKGKLYFPGHFMDVRSKL